MNYLNFIGQTLDGKYHIERELGRGGMGTVYLATHLGTERPVAVKIIAPQFMQRAEFVERFRREARAAGRLRHPNVVDVTDFGFADSTEGQVAYLVMEYLDGCTLGEILDEEKNLPVAWTLDILEQVCSAVQEAHEMGIIHRDLKPDNIWLEPNQRGGYTVKVLDFGIAKLEENDVVHFNGISGVSGQVPTYVEPARITLSGSGRAGTLAAGGPSTLVSEASTIALMADQGTGVSDRHTVSIEPLDLENKTAILSSHEDANVDQDTIGTRVGSDKVEIEHQRTTGQSLLDSPSTAGLTRVGAVLGTPLYMSPEQCRGEHLDPRSDIYSLGVIAYQMLSGDTPFSGDFKDVMESHKSVPPPPLMTKGVRRKMRQSIMLALDKDPEKRPQTAEGFASVLRSRSEGIFGLLRRALVIYSEHLPKFIFLASFFSIPTILLTVLVMVLSFMKVSGVVSENVGSVSIGFVVMAMSIVSTFCTYLIIGTITWVVAQYLAVPLRPIRLRPALVEARKKWKTFAGTGVINTLLIFLIGAITCGIGFPVLSVLWTLVAPVVMMENVRGRAALKRSKDLVKRSIWTSAGAVLIMFLIPFLIAASISLIVNLSFKALDPKTDRPPVVADSADGREKANGAVPENTDNSPDINIQSSGSGIRVNIGNDKPGERDMQTRVKHTILESLIQVIWVPLQIIVVSFSAIIVALLYVKTRLAGGESMNDLIELFEDDERPRKKWQERVRARLIQSGRIPSKS
jgi:serine/threonine protein kinase